MIPFTQFVDSINEESAAGHPHKRIIKWLKVNGYSETSHNGKHPKFAHEDTNHIVTGINIHAKDNVGGIRGMISAVKTHHTENKIMYHPLDSKIDSM